MSVSLDGRDEHGLKLEKVGQTFSMVLILLAKLPKMLWLVLSLINVVLYVLHNTVILGSEVISSYVFRERTSGGFRGEARPPPLFLDQSEEKSFGTSGPPPPFS